LAGVAGAQVPGAAEVEGMELVARMTEQLEEMGDALHVLEPRVLALAVDGPDVALVSEARGAARGSACRPRRHRDRVPRRPGVCREPLLEGDEPEPGSRRGGRRFERGGAVTIAVRRTSAQAARQLALRVGELWKGADPLVRLQRRLEVG